MDSSPSLVKYAFTLDVVAYSAIYDSYRFLIRCQGESKDNIEQVVGAATSIKVLPDVCPTKT